MARAPRINYARYTRGTRLLHSKRLKVWLAERGAILGRTVAEVYALTLRAGSALSVMQMTKIIAINRVVPVITGTLTNGSTLTVTAGTWQGLPAPTLTRAWLRDNVVIAGATALTYVLVAGDVGKKISVRETATNTAGVATVDSLQTSNIA